MPLWLQRCINQICFNGMRRWCRYSNNLYTMIDRKVTTIDNSANTVNGLTVCDRSWHIRDMTVNLVVQPAQWATPEVLGTNMFTTTKLCCKQRMCRVLGELCWFQQYTRTVGVTKKQSKGVWWREWKSTITFWCGWEMECVLYGVIVFDTVFDAKMHLLFNNPATAWESVPPWRAWKLLSWEMPR